MLYKQLTLQNPLSGLCKFFQFLGRFPRNSGEVPAAAVEHVARQVGVPASLWSQYKWHGRTMEYHRARIRFLLGFREPTLDDGTAMTRWLTEQVGTFDRHRERLTAALLEWYRSQKIEAPAPDSIERMVRSAVQSYDANLCETVWQRTPVEVRARLQSLLLPLRVAPEPEAERIPAVLQELRADAGPANLETIEQELDKLERVRAMGLPKDLFASVPPKVLQAFRQRAAVEALYELRRHPEPLSITLLAAYCHGRGQDLTDTVIDLLVDIVHHIGSRAETRVEEQVIEELKRVAGKNGLLYNLAEAVLGHPDGVIKEVIYPVVSEEKLRDLVKEFKSNEALPQTDEVYFRYACASRIIQEMAPVDSGELRAALADDLGRRSGSRSRRIGVVPEPKMSVPRSVADVLSDHVTLEVEGIDRMYLNVYVPGLQREQGVVRFFRFHRGHQFVSSALMDPISKSFVAALEEYAQREKIPIVQFRKGQRKDDIAAEQGRKFHQAEGVVFIGRAQEKTPVFRTERRRNEKTGATYPWLVRSTAMVNHFYIYGVDRDFGPFFLKFSTYFPYNAKLCINGHEYAKRQLARKGIGFEALDNGVLRCDDPKRLQAICDGLSAEKIDALLRKWLRLLPHPYSAHDRKAGYLYQISVLQAEFSLTQILDRPVTGRVFFEEVIRENLDIGRPSQVQLIFDRRISRRTPGKFRTRVITDGVVPSLHVDYKSTRIKQYHKEGRALRTETTINNTRDFGIGKLLRNLPALRQVGFQANRRLLDVQKISHDCSIGEDTFDRLVRPAEVEGQRASALRFGDKRVQALFAVLAVFSLQLRGFNNREMRTLLAPLLGLDPAHYPIGRMTYDLRRLRLHGIIERIPQSHRYQLTPDGLRIALFFSRTYARLLRPKLAQIMPEAPPIASPLRAAFDRLNSEIDACCKEERLAA